MLFRRTALAVLALLATSASHAALTNAGDLMFTTFNADEDGLAFVVLKDVAPNTVVYFRDDEWTGSAFDSANESAAQWDSGSLTIAAGTVVRFSAYDKVNRAASIGTLTYVAGHSGNLGIGNSGESIYAYMGTNVDTPTLFLSAIANASFSSGTGLLTGTGLTAGLNALALNTGPVAGSSPDFGQYNGPRSGKTSYAQYSADIGNLANWTIDTSDGTYTTTVPNTTAFTVTPAVPEPASLAMLLAGVGVVALVVRRRAAR